MAQFEHLDPDIPVVQRSQAIFAKMLRLIEAAPKEVALYLAVTAGLGIFIDLQGLDVGRSNTAVNIASVALGYLMNSAMLRKSGLAPEGIKRGFGTYLGISILSSIATIIGLVLLVVPGVLLLVRWSAAFGYALAEGEGATAALSRSWHETRPHFWPILLALMLPAGLMIVGIAMYIVPEFIGQTAVVSVVAGNITIMLCSVFTAAWGLAVYALIAAPGGDLRQVFE